MSEIKTQYRIVCHGAGQPGHHEHVFSYLELEVATRMQVKRTVEWERDPKTKVCTPFHLEERQISDWAEYTEPDESFEVDV